MTHRYVPLNWIQWLTLVLSAAVALGFAWGFHEIKTVQSHQNDALRSIICRAERVVRTEPGLTTAERRRAERFYVGALVDAHLKPCDP
jgi:hypothetical protein